MAQSEREQYKTYVAAQLNRLSPLLQCYAMGDFSENIPIPEEEDEFTELFVGLNLMVDDIREMLREKEETIAKLQEQAKLERLIKERTTELQASEERFRQVVENMPVMLDAFDQDFHICLWNRECERVTGYTADEMIGNLRALELLYPDEAYRNQMMKAWSARTDGYYNWEGDIMCKDGTRKTVAWSNISAKVPIPGWVTWGIGVDITERKQIEARMTEQRNQLLALLDGIEDVIYVADPETYELLHVNEAFSQYWGNDVIGKKCYRILQNREAPCPFCTNDRIFSENVGQVYVWEFQNEVTRRWYRCSDKAIRWTDGRWVRFEIAADITELKQAQQERERLNTELAQKNKELEQVVYVTSHDLRSPLVNVQGFSKELNYSLQEIASLIQAEQIPEHIRTRLTTMLEEDIAEDIQYILIGIAKMDTLLTGLLHLSRLGRVALTISDLDMNACLAEVVNTLEFQIKERGVTIGIAALPPCQGDAVQINQVFSNLVGNALKYLDPARPGVIKIWGKTDTRHAVYCVEDNGIGMEKEHQEHIFEIFHRLNPAESPGEGLGLTIVRRILERHHGSIRVESEPGAGSKFYVTLPGSGLKVGS